MSVEVYASCIPLVVGQRYDPTKPVNFIQDLTGIRHEAIPFLVLGEATYQDWLKGVRAVNPNTVVFLLAPGYEYFYLISMD